MIALIGLDYLNSSPWAPLIDLDCTWAQICRSESSQVIYLNPQFIQQLLRPLFDESCGGRLWAQRTLARQDAIRLLATGTGLTDSEKESAIAAADHLVNTGELSLSALECLLSALECP